MLTHGWPVDLGNELRVLVQLGLDRPPVEAVEPVAQDIGLLLEGCAAVRLPDGDRTQRLRRRCLAILLDGLSAVSVQSLPGPEPQPDELNWRWRK